MAANPALEEKLLTETEYEALGSDYEIIDGLPVERNPMSSKAVIAKDNIYDILKAAALRTKLGYVFNDGMIFYMWKTSKGIKGAFIPDVAFVRKENLVKDWNPDKNYPGIPDLAVEVVSSKDEAEKVITKVDRYLARGTEQVWVIYPESGVIHQYFRDAPDNIRVYRGQMTLSAEPFFLDVSIVVADIFKLPELD